MTSTALPYRGTEGWSGSDTSRDRAEREVVSGNVSKRQQRILEILLRRQAYGATWSEIGLELNVHHGSVSGSLSVLHQAGQIARLTDRRHRSAIYVLPECVLGRETAPHGSTKKATCANCGESNG